MWSKGDGAVHLKTQGPQTTTLTTFKKAPDTPLRPHILAAFLPWGSFAGAGRPARGKGKMFAAKLPPLRGLMFVVFYQLLVFMAGALPEKLGIDDQ